MSIYVPKVAYVTEEERQWYPTAMRRIIELDDTEIVRLGDVWDRMNKEEWVAVSTYSDCEDRFPKDKVLEEVYVTIREFQWLKLNKDKAMSGELTTVKKQKYSDIKNRLGRINRTFVSKFPQ